MPAPGGLNGTPLSPVTAMVCQICHQPNRKPRFQSTRLTICKWCITELCNSEISPNQIFASHRLTFQQQRREKIEREIAWLERCRSATPTIDMTKLAHVNARALAEARGRESFFSSLYRSFVNDSARNEDARLTANRLHDQLVIAHDQACVKHAAEQRQIEFKLSKLHLTLLDVEAIATQDANEFVLAALLPAPTKSKEVKLLRANALHIVSANREQVPRPRDTEFEDITAFVRRGDGYRCVRCSKDILKAELHVHHVIPLSNAGTNDPRNLVTLCYSCHNKQHPGFTVSRNQPSKRGSRIVTKSARPVKTLRMRKPNIPKSRKGWMDCPNCLSSIQIESEQEVACQECGWTRHDNA